MNKLTVHLRVCSRVIFSMGCSLAKPLTIQETKDFNNKDDFLVIDIQNKKFELYHYKFRNGYLEGDLYNKTKIYNNNLMVSATYDKELVIKGKSSVYVQIPEENIRKIEFYEATPTELTILWIVLALGSVLLISAEILLSNFSIGSF